MEMMEKTVFKALYEVMDAAWQNAEFAASDTEAADDSTADSADHVIH